MTHDETYLLRIHVMLSNVTLSRIEVQARGSSRAEFIRKAIDRYLDEAENGKTLLAGRDRVSIS